MSTEIQVDDETRAALLLFNERVDATAAKERGRKRVAKAERAKDEAAKKVRTLNSDENATAEQKAEAEAEYKEASDNFLVVQANPNASEKKPAKAEAPEATKDTEAPAEPVPATPTEVSADEEAPAAETPTQETPAEEQPAAAEATSESE